MAAGSLWPDTGSGWPKSDTSRLALYLARIFMRGRSFSHHCSRGILCLWSRRSTRPVRPAPTGARQGPVPIGLAPAAMAPLGRPAAPLPQCCGSLRGGRQHRPRRSGRLAPRPRHEGVDVRGFVYLLEVCLLLQLYHGPEHKVSLRNAQHADGLIGHEPFPCKRRDLRLEARGRSAVRPTAAGGRGDNDSSSSSHLSRRTPDARLPAAVTRGRRATWESP